MLNLDIFLKENDRLNVKTCNFYTFLRIIFVLKSLTRKTVRFRKSTVLNTLLHRYRLVVESYIYVHSHLFIAKEMIKIIWPGREAMSFHKTVLISAGWRWVVRSSERWVVRTLCQNISRSPGSIPARVKM